jgi:GT2 family glycosyltransferase
MAEKAALCRYQVDEVNRRIAGHLMVMRKKTWMLIRNEVIRTTATKMILGVDTKISNAIIAKGLKIRIMKGLYIFHYLRMKEGFDFKGHLL